MALEKYSIDKWDQLKEQFTSNFAGAMGRSSTRMDLAMVKQEQGETLRKYMRRFFDKSATVVDVTDKEVIDLSKTVSTIVAPSKLQPPPPELHHQAQRHDHFMGRRRRQGERKLRRHSRQEQAKRGRQQQ
jgi:hypothetical protein